MCLRAFEASGVPKLDITGGAPELHPQFRALVQRARALGRHVMDRCNLTILMLPAHAGLAEFLAAQKVEIIASLPSPNLKQTDAQRGSGVFEKSIAALQRLNEVGYGRDPELPLVLVTNPVGAFLPASQAALERDWKRELHERHGVAFDYPQVRVTGELEDGQQLERVVTSAMVANAKRWAGPRLTVPSADPADDLVDVLLLEYRNFAELALFWFAILFPGAPHLKLRFVTHARMRRLRVRRVRARPLHSAVSR